MKIPWNSHLPSKSFPVSYLNWSRSQCVNLIWNWIQLTLPPSIHPSTLKQAVLLYPNGSAFQPSDDPLLSRRTRIPWPRPQAAAPFCRTFIASIGGGRWIDGLIVSFMLLQQVRGFIYRKMTPHTFVWTRIEGKVCPNFMLSSASTVRLSIWLLINWDGDPTWTCHILGQRFPSSNGKQHWVKCREFIAIIRLISGDVKKGKMGLRPSRPNSHGSHGSITKIKCEMLWNCVCINANI